MRWDPAYTVRHRLNILGGIPWIIVLLYEVICDVLNGW
jgi:hypothetical protein